MIFRKDKPPVRLLEVIYHENELCYQVCWGEHSIFLLKKYNLFEQDYTHAWVVENRSDTNITFVIGSGKMQIDHKTKSYGLFLPGEQKSIEFIFKNVGDTLLTFSTPKSGCKCSVAELEKSELFPGEGMLLKTYSVWGKQNIQADIYTSNRQ